MAKRRLTRQQRRRIDNRRSTGGADSEYDDGDLGPEQPGLVIACFGAQVDVEGADSEVRRVWLRANLGSLVAGDEVRWRAGTAGGVVVARQPRRSELSRPDFRGRPRPVAANIDYVAIVIAPDPAPHAGLIDRYLVAVESQQLDGIIVLNKCDLVAPSGDPVLPALLETYRAIGYPIVEVSARRGDGLDTLRRLLCGNNNVITGQSGVGKSSLINALLPGAEARVGELSGTAGNSDGGGKGRHTTTTARLFHLPDGGNLIDSPGIRELGLAGIDRTEVAAGFREFRPFLGRCRFRDCRHGDDPGCALREARDAGLVSSERFASYHQIVVELGA